MRASDAGLRHGRSKPQALNTMSEARIGPATLMVEVQFGFSLAISPAKAYLVRANTIRPAAQDKIAADGAQRRNNGSMPSSIGIPTGPISAPNQSTSNPITPPKLFAASPTARDST